MPVLRQSLVEFIRASKQLLKMDDLSDEEDHALRDMLWQLSVKFPDEGDDAAD